MNRLFLVLTEKKRIKRRVSFYIAEIVDNKMKLIDNDFNVLIGSNRGLLDEAVNFLVEKKVLPSNCVDAGGYINYENKDYNIIHIESQDIAYANFR